jgi:hypothetical protein
VGGRGAARGARRCACCRLSLRRARSINPRLSRAPKQACSAPLVSSTPRFPPPYPPTRRKVLVAEAWVPVGARPRVMEALRQSAESSSTQVGRGLAALEHGRAPFNWFRFSFRNHVFCDSNRGLAGGTHVGRRPPAAAPGPRLGEGDLASHRPGRGAAHRLGVICAAASWGLTTAGPPFPFGAPPRGSPRCPPSCSPW